MAGLSLSNPTSTSATSREWVLAPVLERVLPELVDTFLDLAKGKTKLPGKRVMKNQKSKRTVHDVNRFVYV